MQTMPLLRRLLLQRSVMTGSAMPMSTMAEQLKQYLQKVLPQALKKTGWTRPPCTSCLQVLFQL
jgi:hypothetical protein